jgi:tryptophan halogenase
MQTIENIVVLGSGSAGLLAAISLKRKLPQVEVTIVRSTKIGIIGVGEGTTPNFPKHFFDYLGISRRAFYDLAQPTWKLGIRFNWGPRGSFNYTFDQQLDQQCAGLPIPNGFYCEENFQTPSIPAALMSKGKAFPKQANGLPDIQPWHAFHLENERLVTAMETMAEQLGIKTIEGDMVGADVGEGETVTALHLEDGRTVEGDFFIDASGFRSELIGKVLEEPFVSFDKSLFCDRAVVGGWDRTDEPILPYTTATAMDSGWAWRIEHENHINAGYVFSSQFISDEEATEEFLQKHPHIKREPRIVRFRSGHTKRQWVGNVVAIGNSGGFVEPLEATALMIVCSNIETLIGFLQQTHLTPTPSIRDLYNFNTTEGWQDIRDFLALHYKVNTASDTPFWKHCQEDTKLERLQPFFEFYEQNGPSGYARYLLPRTNSDFGMEGYLVMMVGNKVPHRNNHKPSKKEIAIWKDRCFQAKNIARTGLTVKKSLDVIRRPDWQWHGDARPVPART